MSKFTIITEARMRGHKHPHLSEVTAPSRAAAVRTAIGEHRAVLAGPGLPADVAGVLTEELIARASIFAMVVREHTAPAPQVGDRLVSA